MYLHSSHLNVGFIARSWLEVCLNFSSSVHEMKKPTRACVYPQVTQLCQRPEKKHAGSHSSQTMHRTHVLLDCAAGIITMNTYKYKTHVWALWWLSFPSICFLQCPQQAPESKHSQGYKTQICYACISCAPEKAPEFGTFSTLVTPLVHLVFWTPEHLNKWTNEDLHTCTQEW